MRVFLFFCFLVCSLVFSLTAWAAHIEDVLKAQQIDADAKTFIPRVVWVDAPGQSYYRCTDRNGSELVAELWRGESTQIRTRNAEPVELIYGELGSIKVFALQDEKGGPSLAAYLLLPSGETHLFRVSKTLEIVKASMQWQCNAAPYRAPPA